MSASATLLQPTLSVDPGKSTSTELRIKNVGTVVDQFSVEVLGSAAPWARLEPPAISLMPGAEGSLTVTFAPPRSSDAAAGTRPFGLKVISSANPADTRVEEGTLSVGIFSDHSAELIPRTTTGSRSGHADLAFDNRGNARFNADLVGADPDAALTFSFQPPSLVAEAGSASFVRVTTRPRKRFLRGNPKSHPYQVQVVAEAAPPVIADGTYVQTAEIPKWVPRVLAAIIAAAIILAILWFAVLKPTVQSTAKDAATTAANDALTKAGIKPGGGGSSGGGGGGGAGSTPTPTSPPGAANPLGDPISQQLSVSAGPGTQGQNSYPVPTNATLSVTDIVFENPQGDTGTLQIQRDGKPLLSVQLANFRDLDYHFVSPLTYSSGKSLTVVLTCQAAGTVGTPPPTSCADFVFFSGYQK